MSLSKNYPPLETRWSLKEEAAKIGEVPVFHDRRVLLNELIVRNRVRRLEDVLELYGEAGVFHPQMRDEDLDAYLERVTSYCPRWEM